MIDRIMNFEYDEFSKISIHNHFGGYDRTIDKPVTFVSNFSYDDAIKKLIEAYKNKFNLLAMTQSNLILPLEYILLKKLASSLQIELILGIEINIKGHKPDKYLHTVILFPDNINVFELKNEFEKNYIKNNALYLDVEQLANTLAELQKKAIIIPHGMKQSNGNKSGSKNPEQLKEIMGFDMVFPVLIEDNKTYHKVQLKNELKKFLNQKEFKWLDKATSVSSVDRNKDITYSTIGAEATYIWGDNTFNDLYFSALMQNTRIKKQNNIITKVNYISKIEISPKKVDAQIRKCTIHCSHGLNSIIGKSGSGKTLLLNIIKYELTGEHLKNNSSKPNREKGYENICRDMNITLYDSQGETINVSDNWKIFEGENIYNQMLEIYSNEREAILDKFNLKIDYSVFDELLNKYDDEINRYIKNGQTIKQNNVIIKDTLNRINENKKFLSQNKGYSKAIQVFTSTDYYKKSEELKNKITTSEKDINTIDKITEIYNNFKVKYMLDENLIESMLNGNSQIKTKILIQLLKHTIKKNEMDIILRKQSKINELITDFNKKLGEKVMAIVEKRKDNKNSVSIIIDKLHESTLLKKKKNVPLLTREIIEKCFPLNKNSSLIVELENIRLTFDELEDVFPNNIGRKSGAIKSTLFGSFENIDLSDYKLMDRFLQIFIDNNSSSFIEINKERKMYIKFEIKVKQSNNTYKSIDTMTAGELSKLYISNMIDSNIEKIGGNLIILFDQPENNLEKEYILEDLIAKLDELKSKFQIFITTHEPLLVVNGDSNKIIYAVNDKILIQKNNINYLNLSFTSKINTKENMVETIAKLIDGSPIAISDRNRIYGGMLNEN
ncbi:MAG: ATP-binding protein [Bacilli bacterium]|nr:ATP-binding protein [Bacilli bacterium]